LFAFFVLPVLTKAQGPPPIGQWREHLPFNNALALDLSGDELTCATPFGFFTFEEGTRIFTRKTKINGLSEVRVGGMVRDPQGAAVMVWYENGNIDFVEGDQVRNLPDILQTTVPGDKRIFHALWRENRVYLSTGLGIIVLDPVRFEVDDTWRPSSNGADIRVQAMAADADFFYAATAEGLKKAPARGTNLADFRVWQTISGNGLIPGPVDDVGLIKGRLYVRKKDTIQVESSGQWIFRYQSPTPIVCADSGPESILVGESDGVKGRVTVLSPDASVVRVLSTPSISLPRQTVQLGSQYWVACQNNGLLEVQGNQEQRVFPNSPISTASGEMVFTKTGLWATAGSVNESWNYQFNPNGIHRFSQDSWSGTNLYVYPILDSLFDFITVAENPANGHLMAGSFGGGLLETEDGKPLAVYKQGTGLQPAIGDPGSYRVAGLAYDLKGDLWIANYGAPQNLVLRKQDGSWHRLSIPFLHTENALAQILVDDQNYKWIQSPKGNGVFCLDDGGTPELASDDRWRFFRQGRGNGNLPSADVLSLAKDRDGFIWIGTTRGIAVVQCLSDIFTSNACEAVLPIVQQDNFAGFLFRDEEVRSIAVDGANRKWVGTKNGVWLVSQDGQEIIQRFTEKNSPLLSNLVNRISVDPATGEVFISTFNGICSFRGTATEATANLSGVLVFPNPVPPAYSGTIAIRGVPDEAWISITEADGRLVYRTRSLGGQAVWDGRNFKGERVSSGAYLVLISDETNRPKIAAKIFFIR
jgi:streptogramin lyase